MLANAGHHDREIDVPALAAAADEIDRRARRRSRPTSLGGRRVHVLVDGALVNIAGLDGNPIEIMDLSFSVQALSIHRLAAGGLAPGVHAFPAELDDLIARTKLATLGIELDSASRGAGSIPRAAWTTGEPLKPVAIIGAGLDLGAGPPRRRHGAVGDPLRRARRAHPRARPRASPTGATSRSPVPEATDEGDPSRPLPRRRSSRRASSVARARRRGGRRRATCRSCSAATTRSRWARSAAWRSARGPGAALWIDAHGDLNRPETSPSGNVHGMPLAAALGAAGDAFATRRLPDAVGRRGRRSSASARSTPASAS